MNKELWLIIFPVVSAALFALGGTQISDTIQGKKWLRRFVLPALLGGFIALAGFLWWQAVIVAVLSCVMFHLGYGSKTSWKMRLLVFLGYGMLSLPMGVSLWNPITFIGCAVMFLLSNFKLTSAVMVWKVAELFFGAVIGVQLGYLAAGQGLVWIK